MIENTPRVVVYGLMVLRAIIFGCGGGGSSGNGAQAIYDLDGDGQLELFAQTFDHGMDVFTVPGSACNCTPWPTDRGGPCAWVSRMAMICEPEMPFLILYRFLNPAFISFATPIFLNTLHGLL